MYCEHQCVAVILVHQGQFNWFHYIHETGLLVLSKSCTNFVILHSMSTSVVCRRLVIGIATTIPLLGLPWIVGLLLRVIPSSDIAFITINYIFIILNASQVRFVVVVVVVVVVVLLMYFF